MLLLITTGPAGPTYVYRRTVVAVITEQIEE